jgi:hypothetical protein
MTTTAAPALKFTRRSTRFGVVYEAVAADGQHIYYAQRNEARSDYKVVPWRVRVYRAKTVDGDLVTMADRFPLRTYNADTLREAKAYASGYDSRPELGECQRHDVGKSAALWAL